MDILDQLHLIEFNADSIGRGAIPDTMRLAREEIERLRSALERTQIGVNHIATYRTAQWPDYGTACDVALEKLGAGQEYDMWCCWNAAMCARDFCTKSAPDDIETTQT